MALAAAGGAELALSLAPALLVAALPLTGRFLGEDRTVIVPPEPAHYLHTLTIATPNQ